MSRYTLTAAMALGAVILQNAWADPTNAWARPPVVIYEVCIKPERMMDPKWVKLRSFSTNDINLKSYSLHDRSGCFYRFDEDCLLRAGKTFVLYFHSWKRSPPQAGLQYRSEVSRYPDCAVITNSNPFAGKAELSTSCWSTVYSEDISLNSIGKLTAEQYDYVKRLADEYRNKGCPTNLPEAVVMMEIAGGWVYYRESDEVALVDASGSIASFVGWGGGIWLQQPATSKWEKAATEAGLADSRYAIRLVGASGNIFSTSHITLERDHADAIWFHRVPFGTPQDTEAKDRIEMLKLAVDRETGEIQARLTVKLKNQFSPGGVVLEIATRPDFGEVICRKESGHLRFGWDRVGYYYFFDLNLDSDEIRALCKQETWHYRARREFDDGDCSVWTSGAEVIYRDQWLSAFGKTPEAMAKGLIAARRKSGESREDKQPPLIPTPDPVPKTDKQP